MNTGNLVTHGIEADRGFDRDWLTVAASAVGMMFSAGAVMLYTFGVFMGPISHEFGWSRGQISGAITLSQVMVVLATLMWGTLLDRFGPRRVILTSVAGLGLALFSYSRLKAPLWHLYLIFGIFPWLGGGVSPVGYSGILVRRFQRRLGLALGLTLMGVGLGGAILPYLAQRVIGTLGWRSAYVAIAATAVAVGLPTVWIATRNTRGPVVRDTSVPAVPLLPILRTRTFLLICATFFLLGLAGTGVLSQLIPMIVDGGLSPVAAAKIAGLVGVSTVVSRGVTGWLLDRVNARFMLAAAALLAAGSCLLLLRNGTSMSYSVVAVLLGLVGGAENDFLAFLIRKYFGAAAFGRLFAVAFAAFALGPGPLVIGFSFDRFHTYHPGLLFFAALSAVAALAALALPRDASHDALVPLEQAA